MDDCGLVFVAFISGFVGAMAGDGSLLFIAYSIIIGVSPTVAIVQSKIHEVMGSALAAIRSRGPRYGHRWS